MDIQQRRRVSADMLCNTPRSVFICVLYPHYSCTTRLQVNHRSAGAQVHDEGSKQVARLGKGAKKRDVGVGREGRR